MAAKKHGPALGSGLDALLGGASDVTNSVNEILLSQIEANPDQPRTDFDGDELQSLADSIVQHGVIQPITLREIGPSRYQIISGERRYRASLLANKSTIPAYVRKVGDDQAVLEMALIENIQRADLNAIEIALAYRRLMDEGGYTQDQMAERVGKKRATVANYLRLLNLPEDIQLGVKDRKIEMGHARVLAGVQDSDVMLSLYGQTVANGWSVRQLEEASKNPSAPSAPKAPKAAPVRGDYSALGDKISQRFGGTKVKIDVNDRGKGKISLLFGSEEELERIVSVLDNLGE
ncbi:MAG: ParB/RepB/Spo0J family partition protein [Paludibacteraceae bacterium]|nr:ParB/RepB/Spo0J family partition protein [Paludibacteraceae bacterium]